ncbi:Protein CDH-1 [Aphelenchoides avenae]|nr:Protein CDH-1 [Aphelenchus avenae]
MTAAAIMESKEIERLLRVPESASVGQQVGFVQDPLPKDTDQQNFYVVFTNPTSQAEKLISVNERTGEVLVTEPLDHEQEAELVFLAIPTNGDITIKVVVQISDVNDHTPKFPVDSVQLEISEFAQIGTELPLPLATDEDSPPFSIQKYRIVEGNVNNVFRLASRRLNNVLYVDLVVNGQLDREYRDHYDLLVEAIDGDEPPKVGKLSAHVSVLDANDNAPMFHQSRYTADIPANASKGLPVLTVLATDPDAGENSRIAYKFKRLCLFRVRKSSEFDINESTGLVRVAQSTAVVAYDHGLPQPLESTVFVAITAQEPNRNDKDQSLDIVWLTDDGSPMLSEGLTLGYVLARVLVRGASEARCASKFDLSEKSVLV